MYATRAQSVGTYYNMYRYHARKGREKNILLSNAITVSRKFRSTGVDCLETRDNRECDFKVDSFRRGAPHDFSRCFQSFTNVKTISVE